MTSIRTPNLHQPGRQAFGGSAHAPPIRLDPRSRRPRRRDPGCDRRRDHDRRPALARRVLDPARGVQPADPGVPEDPRRGELQPVLRRLRRPDACREGGPQRRHRRALARPGHGRARRRRPRRRELEAPVVSRHGHPVARRLRRPRREPEEDLRLERPDPEGRPGRDAEPVHLRRRPLERDGRLRRAAQARQDRPAGAGLPAEAVQERRLAGQERARRAADLQRRPRRRAARLRERGAVRTVAGPEPPVPDPAVDDPDREPDRRR